MATGLKKSSPAVNDLPIEQKKSDV